MTDETRDRCELILAFVAAFWDEHGYAPTVRDVQDGCGYGSPSAAAYRINQLIGEGMLTHIPRRPRTLRVVEQP